MPETGCGSVDQGSACAAQLELIDVRIADGAVQLDTITDDMAEAVASILVIENYRRKAKTEGRP